jgi:serine protease inhibitor
MINLGMGIAFADQADFSKISNQGLKISRVLHQTFIDNNEEGTEAAAATVVEIVYTTAGPSEALKVNLDHPFLYFIRESTTGTIIFMGKVSDPALN